MDINKETNNYIALSKWSKTIKKGCWVLLAGLMLLSLSFAENCDLTRNSYDTVHCDNKVYANADNELNKVYQ